EQLAETLFRQWFVEEAEEGWEKKFLKDYVNCINGVSYKSSELKPSLNALVTLKSFDRNGGFRIDGFKEFTGRYKEQQVVNEGDLVVAHTDITQEADVIGNPVLVVSNPNYEKMIISMDLVKVNSNFEWLSKEFIYLLMRTREFKYHCLGHSNGSTVLHLSKSAIPTYEFNFPPLDKILEFTKIVKPMIDKKFKNLNQIQTLTQLRDSLLPKLMSGEVKLIIN
ncbi:MAG TPA: restriction endonuclease subunit S, partial [Ignavibacteria bacterium]|nr:restriction endonuclease subunit S [Ignavibacteria bacterium]HMR41844.1 restriction endonuclease subunit S [Ignavibacteria bacterium]